MLSHEKIGGSQSDGVLSTSRFFLKIPTPKDYKFLYEMYSDPEVMKYISTGVRDEKKTRESLNQFIQHWNERGFGMWIVHSKENHEKIGYMGFRFLEGKEGIEFGGLLIKKAWRQGSATEIGKVCLEHGFKKYKFDHIYAVVDPKNAASLHWINKKLSMQRESEKDGIFHNTFMHYFSITSDQFKNPRATY
jgi:RimJ/RimL family protein N-acetyltransferase